MLYLEMTMVGVFASLDVILFSIFLGINTYSNVLYYWILGSRKKILCCYEILLYTFIGSLIMLIWYFIFWICIL